MRYNILWIDDDYKTQEDFISFAEQLNIDITPFESHEEGMVSLAARPYHAVILDAKVKKGKDDTKTGVAGLAASRDRLIEINKDSYLPFFIFTGQPDYMEDEMFVQSYGEYYTKGDDNEKLIKDIISACEKHPEIQARKSYPEIFFPFDNSILSEKSKNLMIDIIKNMEAKNFAKKNLTTQRDLLESIFQALNNPIPCLPDSFFDVRKNGKPTLAWCVRFIEDKETNGYKLNKDIPQKIKSSFRKVLETTNEYSHLSDETELKIPFLANTFVMMEILQWLPQFVKTYYPNYI